MRRVRRRWISKGKSNPFQPDRKIFPAPCKKYFGKGRIAAAR
jgi:hypothetical protein